MIADFRSSRFLWQWLIGLEVSGDCYSTLSHQVLGEVVSDHYDNRVGRCSHIRHISIIELAVGEEVVACVEDE
jgi:hypothetical protein